MRENFDFVTFDNYSADMAELSAMASVAIHSKATEVKALQRMVWMLVQANGGRVVIPREVQEEYQAGTAIITVEYMNHDWSTVVSTR